MLLCVLSCRLVCVCMSIGVQAVEAMISLGRAYRLFGDAKNSLRYLDMAIKVWECAALSATCVLGLRREGQLWVCVGGLGVACWSCINYVPHMPHNVHRDLR